jgi:hypothetical protein
MKIRARIIDYGPQDNKSGTWTISLDEKGHPFKCEDNCQNVNGRALIGKTVDGFLYLKSAKVINICDNRSIIQPQFNVSEDLKHVNIIGKHIKGIQFHGKEYVLIESIIVLAVAFEDRSLTLTQGEWLELSGVLAFDLDEKWKRFPKLLLLTDEYPKGPHQGSSAGTKDRTQQLNNLKGKTQS